MIIRGTDRVLVMGITGKQGTFWTEHMQAYGTKVVGGTHPNKAGTLHCDVPVFVTAGKENQLSLNATPHMKGIARPLSRNAGSIVRFHTSTSSSVASFWNWGRLVPMA